MKLLSQRQITSAIKSFGHKRTIFVQGEKGIGKTAMHYNLQRDPAFADFIFPAPMDATQMSDGSLWMPDLDREAGVSRELPNEALGLSKVNQRGIAGARPVFLTFDEVGKAPRYIKNYLATLVNEHRIGGYYLPEGSIVLCLTNLSQEGLGDEMQAHFADRLIHMTMRKPTLDEWKEDFAVPRKLNEVVVAACELFPSVFDSFLDYEPGGKFAGKDMAKCNYYVTNPRIAQTKCTTPRSIHAASDVVNGAGSMDDDTLEAALMGTVGDAFAKEIMTTLRFGRQLPDYERVIADPEHTPVPKDPTPQIVQVFQFVSRAERADVQPIVTYVQRMRSEMQGLFATTVSKSGSAAMFATNKDFGGLMANQRNYF